MTRDELEYSISQYLDGTLPPLERASVDEHLAADPSARELLAEYERLGATLRLDGDRALATINDSAWSDFSETLSKKLGAAEAPVAPSYRMGGFWAKPLRYAGIAAVLLVAGFGVAVSINRQPTTTATITSAIHSAAKVEITGPTIASAEGPVVRDVAIAAPADSGNDGNWRYADLIVTRPSRVIIARGDTPAQDTSNNSALPY